MKYTKISTILCLIVLLIVLIDCVKNEGRRGTGRGRGRGGRGRGRAHEFQPIVQTSSFVPPSLLESSALREVNVHGQSVEGPNISGSTAEGLYVGSGRAVQGGGGPSGSGTHDSNIQGPNEEGTSGHRQTSNIIQESDGEESEETE
uniref:Uncharacterized protein n=1 Tax=Meloidogyne floridensis TaxID=298350 RepID=A0A915NMG7_9BILA